jgi:hypothetical protein
VQFDSSKTSVTGCDKVEVAANDANPLQPTGQSSSLVDDTRRFHHLVQWLWVLQAHSCLNFTQTRFLPAVDFVALLYVVWLC